MYSNSIVKILKTPRLLFARFLMREPFCRCFSDEVYLRLSFWLCHGYRLNLDSPESFNEKIQWLKLHNNSDLCKTLVDKYAVREHISNVIGEDYLIPCLGVWESFDQIDFSKLPNQFVLKCTHDSGSVVICKDKSKLDIKAAKNKLSKALKNSFYWIGREHPYKDVPSRIIAEEFLEDNTIDGLADFKFFCFNGVPRILFYASDRFNKLRNAPKFDFYDMQLRHLPISRPGHGHSKEELVKFPQFDQMKILAEKLSNGFPFVRIDFYLVNKKIYFGEFTFHPSGGYVPFQPADWDRILGEWINLDGYR